VKFLIDECLGLPLVQIAWDAGYPESSHVVWQGKAGWKDWRLVPAIVEGAWTFVTRNAYDFRGPAAAPGSPGLLAGEEIHAGLICLIHPVMDLNTQAELFLEALALVAGDGHLINQVLEVWIEGDEIAFRRYAMPKPS
jgi:hypothetical protein